MQDQGIGEKLFPKSDAVSMLADDHERVRRLWGEFERCHANGETAVCRELADVLCHEVEIHALLEQEIFYPAARQALDRPGLIDEAEVEHETVAGLVQRIRSLAIDDPKWVASITVLGHYVRHHADEEERGLMWMMRQSGVDLTALGERMHARRRELDSQRGLSHPNSAEALPV